MVTIKSAKIFEALAIYAYPKSLIEIALFIIMKMESIEVEPVVTSAYRKDDTGVHGNFRGLDFRTWDLNQIFIDELCDEVNRIWLYDPERPEKVCLLFHDVGRGPHLHLQVHPRTRRV